MASVEVAAIQIIGRDNGTTAALVPTFEAVQGTGAGNGNHWDNQGLRKFLWVVNGDASPTTVTIKTSNTRDGDLILPDATFVVAAGTQALWGEAMSSPYEQVVASIQKAIKVEWSNATAITYAVVVLPKGVEGG